MKKAPVVGGGLLVGFGGLLGVGCGLLWAAAERKPVAAVRFRYGLGPYWFRYWRGLRFDNAHRLQIPPWVIRVLTTEDTHVLSWWLIGYI